MATTYDNIAGDGSTEPSIDADGNLVAFEIAAQQVWVENMQSGAVTVVSQTSAGVEANLGAQLGAISSDGSSVSFATAASNLASGVPQGASEVYIKNLQSGGLAVASQTGAGIIADNDSYGGALSSNGQIVSFISNADNLGLGVAAGGLGVYVKNETTGDLTLASQSSAGVIGNGDSASASSISANGDVVAFDSNATNLGSASGAQEIYVKSVSTGTLTIASETSDGTIANGNVLSSSISADGTEVAFASNATNLSPDATSGNYEIYVKNLLTGALTLVSSTAAGAAFDDQNTQPVLSADGKYVAFTSGSGGAQSDVYVKNLQTGALGDLSPPKVSSMVFIRYHIGTGSGQVFSADDTQVVFDLSLGLYDSTDLRATTPPPTVAFDPLTINATELASPVTFSGTSNAIGGTIQLSIDGSGSPIGTAAVAINGQWSLTADVSDLSEGAHTETAITSYSYLPSTTSSQTFQVDTTPPSVAVTPGVAFEGPHWATLMGTVSDPFSAVTNVEIFEDGADVGAATLNGDGSWTFTDTQLPFGDHSFSAAAIDAVGNASAQTSLSFSLQTGVLGQPYAEYEADFDSSGNLTGEYFTKRSGVVYLADTVTNLPNGNIDVDYSAGTYFNAQSYYNQDDLYGSQWGLKVETLYNDDGTTSVTGYKKGQVLNSVLDDTMTGGGNRETFAFATHFGQDVITDFQVRGAGHDFISLSTQDFSSVGQALNHTWDVDGSAVIHIGRHQTITLDNVTTAELHANPQDFKFHA